MKKNMLNTILYFHKKLKFLLELIVLKDGSLKLSSKLTILLNQNGVYEVDKLIEIINSFFTNIKFSNIFDKEYSFLIPIIFIFPKKEEKTIVILSNPIYLTLVSNIIFINLYDIYLYYFTKINFFCKNYAKSFFKLIFQYYFYKPIKKKLLMQKINFNFFKKKKQNYTKNYISLTINKKKKIRKLLLKWRIFVGKKRKLFYFFNKSLKYINYEIYFKLSLIKTTIFFTEIYYFELKNFFYSLVHSVQNYKRWYMLKFRKKMTFKKLVNRNIFGYYI